MSDSIKHHPLLAKLQQQTSGTVRLQGYIGPSERDGYLSLYADLGDLSERVEIPESAIVHHEEAPEEVLPFGGTFLWVKADADVVYERNLAVRTPADMLSGAIAKAHLSDVQSPPITAHVLAPRMFGKPSYTDSTCYFQCGTNEPGCPVNTGNYCKPPFTLDPLCLPTPWNPNRPTRLPCVSRHC